MQGLIPSALGIEEAYEARSCFKQIAKPITQLVVYEGPCNDEVVSMHRNLVTQHDTSLSFLPYRVELSVRGQAAGYQLTMVKTDHSSYALP